MRDAQPQTIRLKDYRVPDFLIDTTDLHFDLYEDKTLVRSRLAMRRNPLRKIKRHLATRWSRVVALNY